MQRAELYGIDDDGTKIKMQNKGFTSSAFGKMKFQKVDSMLNFESSVPSAMQKKWQRNLQTEQQLTKLLFSFPTPFKVSETTGFQ